MISDDILDRVGAGAHHAPHDVLGLHSDADESGSVHWHVRTLRPLARQVRALFDDGETVELTHVRAGVFAGPRRGGPGRYVIEATYDDGTADTADDPYRHLPTLGELDLHLIRQGRHERLWEVLGAHLHTDDGTPGCAFAVWAPNARAVRVAGDHNRWDGRRHAMRSLGDSGVWELFIPGVTAGDRYKFEILTPAGDWIMKADPLAREAQTPPETASVVTAVSTHVWHDHGWLDTRAQTEPSGRPLSIYELHVGSWRPGLDYRALADELIPYVTAQGFTHVEFMPLAEHPFGGSWGYQVSGYYAPTSRFGDPDGLRELIDRLHVAGIGVLLDWVPGHFPKDAFALGRFDGTPLYEHPDPRRGEHRDWGTYIFDYGRNEVRNFLVANALYWLSEFHVDGLRVDAVASMLYLDYSRPDGEWLPNIHGGRENLEAIAFLQEVTATAYRVHPGIMMIAEESTSFPGVTARTDEGGLGFGFKWNMGWMNDTLTYIERDPLYRGHHEHELTFSFVYAFSENYVLPISHDEVVHGKGSLLQKMPGGHDEKLAGLRGYLGYMWAHPGKQLLFMGQEFGQLSEWSEERGLDWWLLDQPSHRGLSDFVAQLNTTYRAHPSLWTRDTHPDGFRRLGGPALPADLLLFARFDGAGETVVAVCNFSGVGRRDLAVDLPASGRWTEVLNSDAADFGGSGEGNLGAVTADGHGRAHVTVAARATVWLRHSAPHAHA